MKKLIAAMALVAVGITAQAKPVGIGFEYQVNPEYSGVDDAVNLSSTGFVLSFGNPEGFMLGVLREDLELQGTGANAALKTSIKISGVRAGVKVANGVRVGVGVGTADMPTAVGNFDQSGIVADVWGSVNLLELANIKAGALNPSLNLNVAYRQVDLETANFGGVVIPDLDGTQIGVGVGFMF
jgi:hypothetical protein